MFEELTEYLKNWHSSELCPKNEEEFIDLFIDFLNKIDDDRDVTFDGDGAYFGKQITIGWNSGVWSADECLHFEVAYSPNKISVYTAKHNGFWTPCYLEIKSNHPRFFDVQKNLYVLLYRVFGLPEITM
jgi:hypothetical protein